MTKKKKTTEIKELHGLFSPIGGKDIRKSYPELYKVPEFAKLKTAEFRFCWSYVYEYSQTPQQRLRIAQAIISAYGNTLPIEEQESWKNYNLPERIRVAIEKLECYDLSARLKARTIIERQLNFFTEMSKFNIEDYKETDEKGNVTIKVDDAKRYADIAKLSNELVPDIVKKMEHNYSVSDEVFEEYTKLGGSALDNYHKLKENKEI